MSRNSIEACTFQLHSWRPFLNLTASLDSSSDPTNHNNHHHYHHNHIYNNSNGAPTLTKRPCLSDRATSFPVDLNSIDISKLSLSEDKAAAASLSAATRGSLRQIAHRKRRRRGSRSLSGRSCSDRSGTRRCCSVGAASAAGAHGTCSDFPLAVGTDSSGEMFGNVGGGDPNWASDASEAKKPSSREKEEREGFGCNGQFGNFEVGPGNESGYGSEPGYRGDGELGYGDEVDEEEEDARLLFWGHPFGEMDSKMEMVGESTFLDQKSHHRGRRKKHDCRMIYSLG